MAKEVYILDTETTGGSNSDQVIELAHIKCPSNLRDWVLDYVAALQQGDTDQTDFLVSSKEKYVERFKPTVAINPHAQKVHGIGKLHLLGCRPYTEAKVPAGAKYIVGHNVAFDHRMLGKPDVTCIDTWAIVKKLRKLGMLTNDHMEGRDKLDTLVSHYYPAIADTLVKEQHNALDDCIKVIVLLAEILRLFPKVTTWEQLHQIQTMGKVK